MPSLKEHRFNKQSTELTPAPTWGEFGSDIAGEVGENVPPLLGAAGVGGYGIGRALGGQRGGTIGAASGLGGVGGMTLGSILSQALAKLGGPMVGLNPNQTHSLMQAANIPGTIGGGLLGAYGGGRLAHKLTEPDKTASVRKQAAESVLDTVPGYAGKHVVETGGLHGNVLPYAALSGAAGGGIGYMLGDTAAGVGGGAGAALGGTAGNILGSGAGALAGGLLGQHTGLSGPALQKMMDQWAHGGSNVGSILGSLYGGYKGIGLARRLADDRGGKEAAARVIEKMALGVAQPQFGSTLMNRAMTGASIPVQARAPASSPILSRAAAAMRDAPVAKVAPEPPTAGIMPEPATAKVLEPTTAMPAPEAAATSATPAAGALPEGATPPKANSSWNLSDFKPSQKTNLLLGLGLAGAGGLAGGSMLYDAADRRRKIDQGFIGQEEDQDFLRSQRKAELERQRIMMHRLQYPAVYGY